jgi:hypothetical protein
MDYIKQENENLKDYKIRLFSNKDLYGLTSQQIADLINKESGNNFSESVFRKWYRIYTEGYSDAQKQNISNDKVLKEYENQKRELYKERQKLRDEKNEYNAWLREQSRMELFYERIDESIERLINKKNHTLPSPIFKEQDSDELFSTYADCHYGCEFSLKGFKDNIINEYNPDIFKNRMIEYRDVLIDFGKLHNIKKLSLVDLGDSIDGILHISQLKSLRGNIVDDILDYADFIEDWLFSLSEHFFINFYTSEGNHSDLRILTGKKGDFPHENLEKVYTRFLKKVFKNNSNVIIHNSLDGLNYFNINGFNFLTAHGNKENNLKTSIQDYESTYDIKVDYFVVGHLHSKNEFEVAKGKEVVQVRSIMGINEFAKDIKKSSDAGATMFVVRKGYGRKYINDVKLK